jgi:hypothetical protein
MVILSMIYIPLQTCPTCTRVILADSSIPATLPHKLKYSMDEFHALGLRTVVARNTERIANWTTRSVNDISLPSHSFWNSHFINEKIKVTHAYKISSFLSLR